MNSTKLLMAAVAAASVVGAASFAVAQTTPSRPVEAQTGTTGANPTTGTPGTMQREAQMPSQSITTNPNTNTPRTQDSTTMGTGSTRGSQSTDRMPRDGNASSDTTGNTSRNTGSSTSSTTGSSTGSTTGGSTSGSTSIGTSRDGTLMQNDNARSSTERGTMNRERAARADRN